MKNTNKRLIAGLLSVVTLLSVATTSVATVSAAEQTIAGVTDQTIGAVLHESSNRKLNTVVQPSEAVSKVIEYILEATDTKGGAILPWGVGKIVGFIFGEGEGEGENPINNVLVEIGQMSQKMDDYHNEEMQKLELVSSKIDIQRFVDMYEQLQSMNSTIISTINAQKSSISTQTDQKTINAYKEILNTISGTSFAELQSYLANFFEKVKECGNTKGFSSYADYLYQQANKGASFAENADMYQVISTTKSELSKMLVVAGEYAMNINALKKMSFEVENYGKEPTEESKNGAAGYFDSTLNTLKKIYNEYEATIAKLDNMVQAEVTVDGVTKGFESTSRAWEVASYEVKQGKNVNLTLIKDWTADLNNGLSTNIRMASPGNKGFTGDGGLYVPNGGTMTLNLNSHKIDMTSKKGASVFTLADKAKLVVKDGTLENGKYGIYGNTSEEGASEQVEIQNTILQNFENGAVYMDGYQHNSLKMNNCEIKNTKNGTGVTATYKVMYDIEHCTFDNNHSTDNGGAFTATMDYVDGIVKDCKFTNNSGKNGGAVASVNTLDNCSFEKNSATNLGGAVYYVCKSITNCTFESNSSDNEGGAVWHQSDISNCKFISNHAKNKGGAMIMYARNDNVRDCVFENNSSNDGGAIYFDIDGHEIKDCTFTNNTANGNGGAIEFRGDEGTDYVKNCTFTRNTAGHDGGAIDTHNHTDVNIYDSTLTYNHAGNKGGAIFFGINNSTNHSLHTVTLTNNEAGNRGGAIYSDSSWQSTGSVNLHGAIILKDNHKTNGQKDNFYGDSTNCGLWTNKAKLEKCGDFDSKNSILE